VHDCHYGENQHRNCCIRVRHLISPRITRARAIIAEVDHLGLEELAMKLALVVLCALACALLASSMVRAQADKSHDDDYRTYEETKVLSAEMFKQFLDNNIVMLRISALLKHCQKEGLAKAVDANLIDQALKDKLHQLIVEGKFAGLPSYAVLEAQSAASAMITGYEFGLVEGIRLLNNSKDRTCAAAIDGANKILGK
jgi:hypothetical protein